MVKKKRRVRRGQQGKKTKFSTTNKSARVCNFYYANVNGFKSKADSIKQLVAENNIDILLLSETKVYTSKATNIKGYHTPDNGSRLSGTATSGLEGRVPQLQIKLLTQLQKAFCFLLFWILSRLFP